MRLTAALLRNRPPTQSPETKLQIMPIESEIVDPFIDDAVIEVQRPNVVAVGRGPAKLEVEHHVASGHAQHRTWCDACMRARGIAGRQERREPGREDEDPLVAIDYGYLKLDGTEDDDDDEDDEVAQKQTAHPGCERCEKLERLLQPVCERKK